MTNSAIQERYGFTGFLIFENAISRLLDGKATVEQAMDYIMEFARGNWSIVVDENLESLAVELERLNYAAETVPKGMPDDQIRQDYSRDVFITANDRDFSLSEVPGTFRRGMILVPSAVDARLLARAIEKVLMNWRKNNPGDPVKVKLERGDL